MIFLYTVHFEVFFLSTFVCSLQTNCCTARINPGNYWSASAVFLATIKNNNILIGAKSTCKHSMQFGLTIQKQQDKWYRQIKNKNMLIGAKPTCKPSMQFGLTIQKQSDKWYRQQRPTYRLSCPFYWTLVKSQYKNQNYYISEKYASKI